MKKFFTPVITEYVKHMSDLFPYSYLVFTIGNTSNNKEGLSVRPVGEGHEDLVRTKHSLPKREREKTGPN